MHLPVVRGTIERRILLNWRVESRVLARLLPEPFEPRLVHGWGVVGVCLIRLGHLRPSFVPEFLGVNSENAAHRLAVQWHDEDGRREGVFVPRRDTSSPLNAVVGGWLFPGPQHRAEFEVSDSDDVLAVGVRGLDGESSIEVVARPAPELPSGSVFRSLEEASRFVEQGALGWSPTAEPTRFDGLELRCLDWSVRPLAVERVRSSLFDDRRTFPEGTITFDSALLMRDVEHEWRACGPLTCDSGPAVVPAP
jgi:hypothetical protein